MLVENRAKIGRKLPIEKNSAFLGKIFFTESFGKPPNYSVGDRIMFKKKGGFSLK